MSGNVLGDYLRARREQVDPADVGVRATGVRRTPGLRREEVATLAGVSADYYLRLEQGRDRNPSRQVLEALAGVFGLDATARDYLLGLTTARPARRTPRREAVPTGVALLLESLQLPAFVESRTFEVLAANRQAVALDPTIVLGTNRIAAMFLDERLRDLYTDWDRVIGGMVAGFRVSVGSAIDDPAVVRLVGELSLGSEDFRRLWARHDVKPLAGGRVTMRHPAVGDLHLLRQKLPLADTDGQVLAIYHAEPGSASERALGLLGSLAASVGEPAG